MRPTIFTLAIAPAMVVVPAMLLAGCNSQPAAPGAAASSTQPAGTAAAAPASTVAVTPSPTAAPVAGQARYAAWAGRWVGPEGLFVDVTPRDNGEYGLEMQSDLDTRGVYVGRESADGITFSRGGTEHLLRASNGDATGLRYLAGKANCLMVASGEGYCRD